MSIKSRNILMIIGGGYLIYIGTRLVMQTRQSLPQNETMFISFGVGFAVFGAIVALLNLWEIWKDVRQQKKEAESDSYIETIEFEEEPEPLPKRKHSVRMVKMTKEEKTLDLDIADAEEALREENLPEKESGEEEEQESVKEQELVKVQEPVSDEEEMESVEEVTVELRVTESISEEAAEAVSEELELDPEEAEDAFPTEEIKLERI